MLFPVVAVGNSDLGSVLECLCLYLMEWQWWWWPVFFYFLSIASMGERTWEGVWRKGQTKGDWGFFSLLIAACLFFNFFNCTIFQASSIFVRRYFLLFEDNKRPFDRQSMRIFVFLHLRIFPLFSRLFIVQPFWWLFISLFSRELFFSIDWEQQVWQRKWALWVRTKATSHFLYLFLVAPNVCNRVE